MIPYVFRWVRLDERIAKLVSDDFQEMGTQETGLILCGRDQPELRSTKLVYFSL